MTPGDDHDVRRLTPDDFTVVTDLLCRAFDNDPWFNFLATQDGRRRDRIRYWLRRGVERRTAPHGECYVTTRLDGVALWLPPSYPSDGKFGRLELYWALLRTSGLGRLHEVLRAISLVVSVEPTVPHFELRVLAVDPPRQRQGVASQVVRPMLQRLDSTGTGASLLCTSAANVALYEHFGFAVTNTVMIPEGPTLWEMWRAPQG